MGLVIAIVFVIVFVAGSGSGLGLGLPPHCTSRLVLRMCTLGKLLACSTSDVCMLALALRSTCTRKSWRHRGGA